MTEEPRIQMRQAQPKWHGGPTAMEYRVARLNGWTPAGQWWPTVSAAVAAYEKAVA